MTPHPRSEQLQFGPFCLIPGERLLTRDGQPVEIGGRSLDLLAALMEQPGRVLSKRELLKKVWPDVVVEDGSLRFHMAGLRKLLGDGEDGARYIATQVGVGYAFVAPIQRLSPAAAGASILPFSPAIVGAAIEGGGLPARPGRVIGRGDDVQLLIDRIEGNRLFTIVGAAGVGKTTLAIEAAYGLKSVFGDQVSFVDLGALEDPGLVSSAIAAALGIVVQAEDPLTVVLGHIQAQRRLIVLDNCEHVIAAAANIVERIHDTAPGVRLVATSREPLRVRGEHVHWLASLDFPLDAQHLSREELLAYPAIELFVERATAADSAMVVDLAAARTIGDICRRLEGMALPIELTAVRAAAHGLEATARLLGERFSLGWQGRRTALPRQQTLQATLDWSYELLTEPERRTFERLSVFVGPFSTDAALQVAADSEMDIATAAAALDELTAKSLVAPDRWGGTSSYRLAELTRAYARERLLLRGQDEAMAASRRHAAHMLDALQANGFPQRDPFTPVPDLSRQLGNIRAALDWSFGPQGDIFIGAPLAAASAPVFLNLSLLAECRTWCARAVAELKEEHLGGSIELELQAALGLCPMFMRGNSDAAERALRRALEIAERLGDLWNQLRVLGRLHIFHERIGDFATAFEWASTALEVARASGEPEAMVVAASLAGVSHHLAGDQTRARSELEVSLRLSLPPQRFRTTFYGFDHRNRSAIALARTLWLQGYADRARDQAARAVSEAVHLEHPITHCIALIWSLSIDFWTGDLEKAAATIEAFANTAEVNAFGPYIAASGGFRGQLAIKLGQAGEALGKLEESLARLRAARYELLTTTFSIALSHGLVAAKRHGEALELVSGVIERCAESGELLSMPELLRAKALAGAAAGMGRGEVEPLLIEALELSRRQGAKGWELRAAIDLAGLKRDASPDEAYALLAEVRSGFIEGADGADLQAADQLLSRLRPAAAGLSGGIAGR